jgi:hypothetical protein
MAPLVVENAKAHRLQIGWVDAYVCSGFETITKRRWRKSIKRRKE